MQSSNTIIELYYSIYRPKLLKKEYSISYYEISKNLTKIKQLIYKEVNK